MFRASPRFETEAQGNSKMAYLADFHTREFASTTVGITLLS